MKVTYPLPFLNMCKIHDAVYFKKKEQGIGPINLREVWCVYQVRNTINDKRYIGITSLPPSARWKQHITASKKENNLPLYCAIRENGIERFIFAVIAWCKSGQEARCVEAGTAWSQGTFMPGGYNVRPEYF